MNATRKPATRISRTTKLLIEALREEMAANTSADYKRGCRRMVFRALIAETTWSVDAIEAYIDKQLAR